jgi:methylaspartate ammonia-lyase
MVSRAEAILVTERPAHLAPEFIHIERVLAVPAVGAGYVEDLAALQAQPLPVAARFSAPPQTLGFRAVREPAEAVSVGLMLDGALPIAWGDCVAVSYGGKAGREPVFRMAEGLAAIEQVVAPALQGRALGRFRALAAEVDSLAQTVEEERPLPVVERSRRALLSAPAQALGLDWGERPATTERVTVERRLHAAVRYGVSQALLQAVAWARGLTMTEVIAGEWGLPLPRGPVPLHAQSGAEVHANADKMIVRHLSSLPHALVDDIPAQLGADGSQLTRTIYRLRDRIRELGGEEYRPTIHLDLHGALGTICDNAPGKMLGHLYGWEVAARPYRLRIESPVILDSRQAQIQTMRTLREYVRARNMSVQLVADEWANTLEDIRAFVEAGAADMIQIKMPDLGSVHNSIDAVLLCKAGGVGAFLGGSYAETDLSARIAVHVALASGAALLMAKPGMGVDEAVSLAQNEMTRALAEIAMHQGSRRSRGSGNPWLSSA